ncbi:MAG: mitochondrial fission process protein 1 [Terrestrivirus sp.]|uniref:Mitochondrial fission process protein 1 n=1 Tax=Terrestrivirus sp. TaxID=2487775 RepID=A0A3G4ZNQ0_9VIRU|nr:MAG: mitochondrial fission process protein 1 [Terrestrivirus sp.]
MELSAAMLTYLRGIYHKKEAKKNTEQTTPKNHDPVPIVSVSEENPQSSGNGNNYDVNKIREIVRPAAYTSEVGEAFRPLVHVGIVNTAYAISILYVIADTVVHTMSINQKLQNDKKFEHLSNDQKNTNTIVNCVDKAVWHTFASMIFPAASVHTIVKFSGKGYLYGMKKMLPQVLNAIKYTRVGSVATGLLAIPFIIHPLDHLTDYAMDNSMRKLYQERIISLDYLKD